MSLIDVSVPCDFQETDKTEKYHDVWTVLRKLWKMLEEVAYRLISGVLGTISKSLQKNLGEQEAKVAPLLFQEAWC